jgi:quinol monooxygenase YgiN
MPRVHVAPVTIVVLLSIFAAPASAQAPTESGIYVVSYVEVMPSARTAMVAALKRYRDASSKESGYVRVDLLEQLGRAGHFVVLEAWKDQGSFEAHGMAAAFRQFQDALGPIRVSGYDQRPYKPLAVTSAAATGSAQAIHVVTHVDIGGGAPAQAQALEFLPRVAEESRKERGAVRFDILQHTMRVNHFTIHEIWENQAALDAHAAAQHTREYRDRVQPLSGSPVDERVFRVVE